jgi:SepF-like predicted cell division protein (DUF552 family)
MGIFDKLGGMFKGGDVELTDDYVELEADLKDRKTKVMIRPFVLENFEDIKPIVDSIREGSTIALVNLGPLRDKDRIGLKRAVDKLKKTIEANEGDIAGFGENWLIATPSFANVFREEAGKTEEVKKVEPF